MAITTVTKLFTIQQFSVYVYIYVNNHIIIIPTEQTISRAHNNSDEIQQQHTTPVIWLCVSMKVRLKLGYDLHWKQEIANLVNVCDQQWAQEGGWDGWGRKVIWGEQLTGNGKVIIVSKVIED